MALKAPVERVCPAHVAIIMDGNRRWASMRGLSIAHGYRRGIAALRAAVRGALDANVRDLTVYGFSTENWQRDCSEIDLLMRLCAWFSRSEQRALSRRGVRVRIVGNVEPFAPSAREGLERLVRATEMNARLTLTLALNYSGRAEIVRAARSIAGDVAAGTLAPDAVDESTLRARMYAPDTPDPDVLIRTGGEFRISNFLLYQLAYTEIFTLPLMWPDFTADHFAEIVRDFAARQRRFGS